MKFIPTFNDLTRTLTTNSSGGIVGQTVIADPSAESINALGAITPTISSVATPEVTLETTGAEVICGRFTVNAGSDGIAEQRLLDGHPDCVLVLTGETVVISSSSAITRVDFVGVGSALDSASNVIAHDESTLANVTVARLQFDFDAADSVHKVEVTLSDTWNSGAEAQVKVEGRSYVK